MTGRPGAAGPKPLPRGLDLPVLDGAVCRGQDPAPWFPRTGESPEAGKALCSACPAQARCLDWALAKGEQVGTWGGATPEERTEILRQRRRDTRQGAVA